MATFVKRPGNKLLVQVRIQGQAASKTFDMNKVDETDVNLWVAQREAEFKKKDENGLVEISDDITVETLLRRFHIEKCETRAGGKWERNRIDLFCREFPHLVARPLRKFGTAEVVEWKDARTKEISSASVNREWNLLSSIFSQGEEWGWVEHNPFRANKKVTRPAKGTARDRVPTTEEIEALIWAMTGRTPDRLLTAPPGTLIATACFAFVFASLSAMRQGEIARLRWKHVDFSNMVAKLGEGKRVDGKSDTKNGTKREVPLFDAAIDVLQALPKGKPDDLVFGMNASQIESLFRKGKARAGIKELHFHDTRRVACIWMAMPQSELGLGLDVMTLASITGHKSLTVLQNHYYKRNMSSVARAYNKVHKGGEVQIPHPFLQRLDELQKNPPRPQLRVVA